MTASQALGIWPHDCGDGKEVRLAQRAIRDGGRGMTMAAIASWLTGAGDWSDRPIVDATGLRGTYDFVVEYGPNYGGSPSVLRRRILFRNCPKRCGSNLGFACSKKRAPSVYSLSTTSSGPRPISEEMKNLAPSEFV
jgi:uncharacterized protein (TIGR03435 family)